MTSRLKQILVKMVRLSSADQRWILRQLPGEQLEKFNRHKGLDILESAKRFRKIDIKNIAVPDDIPNPLPAFCMELANKSPLYAAIILEQGSYPWQTLFLQQFDSDNLISNMLETRVPDIKTAVKQALHDEWASKISPDMENPPSFESYLEHAHG